MDKVNEFAALSHSLLPFHMDNEIHIQVNANPEFYGNMDKLKEFCYSKQDYQIMILAEQKEQFDHLQKKLKEIKNIEFKQGMIHQGFEIDLFKQILLQDFEICNKKKTDYTKSYKSKILTQELESIYDIKSGDYVVHLENGIGLYHGIKRIETEGNIKDYFVIEYAHSTNLFLPLEKINMLHKYMGDDDTPPAQ